MNQTGFYLLREDLCHQTQTGELLTFRKESTAFVRNRGVQMLPYIFTQCTNVHTLLSAVFILNTAFPDLRQESIDTAPLVSSSTLSLPCHDPCPSWSLLNLSLSKG